MITAIAKTQYYDISADPAKNRIYLTLSGFWPNKAAAPDYINDVSRTIQNVTPGFTILSDLRTFKTAPEEVTTLLEQGGGIFLKAGLKRTAFIMPQEITIQQVTLDDYSKTSGMKTMNFHDAIEAEKWLDAG